MHTSVLQFCKKEKLIENGNVVLAGVSGGADSVCLLLLLKEMQQELDFVLEAVHVEHGIRGVESENDAAFVEELCEKLEIPLHLHFVRAVEYASDQKIGLEEAARILRYDCYRKDAENIVGASVRIALAHHADDNAETVLFQMIRGSGIDGLGGMRPKRVLSPGIELVRPLLMTSRVQIETFLEKRGQKYCIDSTNADVAYSRNKMRHEVLPKLGEINAQAVLHINQSAGVLQELGDYLRKQVEHVFETTVKQQEEGILLLEAEVLKLPQIIQKEVMHLALAKAAGCAKDIGMVHVELLQELFQLQVGRRISLPYQVCAKRVYDGVLLIKTAVTSGKKAESEQESKVQVSGKGVESEEIRCDMEIDGAIFAERLKDGAYKIEIPGGEICFSLHDLKEKTPEISKKRYTKCFDYDKIIGSFQIRTRRSGDYLIVDEDGHRKRLKEYFINEKVPSEERDKVLLLVQGAKVIWIIGGRISADVKVSQHTKRILEVQIIGGNFHES